MKLNAAGSAFAYATPLGGSGHDSITGIALDAAANVYLAGSSLSEDFPATVGAYQTGGRGRSDALVLKIIEGTTPPRIATVSSASFQAGAAVAAGSIVTGFGQRLAGGTEGAAALPLPTRLAGVSVKLTDAAGNEQFAPLILVTPAQINFVMPETSPSGLCAVTVIGGDRVVAAGTVRVETVAPSLFSANANGRGVAAASAVRVAGDTSQAPLAVFRCGNATSSCLPEPLELGEESDGVFLSLFGTGIRGRSSLAAVGVSAGGMSVPVTYAGPSGFVGLDQVNVGPLPRALAGRGDVDVILTVEGKKANTVIVNIK